ncbi:MAG: hypothetical protein Q8911_00515, partial [Bacillota bacterium]|nr:hypothetical protein [Bacillota bacterium]
MPTISDNQGHSLQLGSNNSLPVSITGSLANNQTNAVVIANTNIFTANYTASRYSKSVLQVTTNTSGVLSL